MHQPVPASPARRPGGAPRRATGPRRRATAAVLVLLTVLLALAGCTRVRTALAVQADDTVAGEIVIGRAGGPPPEVVVPPAIAERVSVSPYHEDGYQGSRLQFSGLRFDEANSLVSVVHLAEGRFRFQLRRAGNLILLAGQVDLTAVPVDRADVQLKIAFPGEVVSSDGELDSGAVSWVFTPGQVNEFSAMVSAPDPTAPSFTRWALLVGALVGAAATGVVLMARAQRNPPVRPTADRGR